MSDNVNGDVTTENKATETSTDTSVTVKADGSNDVVPKKELESVIKESIKRKQELSELKKQTDDYKKQLEAIKTQGMKDKDMWKELAEQKEKEARELEGKYSGLQSAIVDNTKFSALKTECMKLGIVPEALDDLGSEWLSMIEIETTSTGRYNVLNAKQVSESIKLKKPYLFNRPGAPNVNTTSPSTNGVSGTLTATKVLELQKKAEKSGSVDDVQAYHKALKALSGQRQTMN